MNGDPLAVELKEIEGLIKRIEDKEIDVTELFEQDNVFTLATIYECNQAYYQRLRAKIKKLNAPIIALENIVKENRIIVSVKTSQASEIFHSIELELELFITKEKIAYLKIIKPSHKETYPINSHIVSNWITSRSYKKLGLFPTKATIKTVQLMLETKAQYNGLEIEPFLRVGNIGNSYILDIGDARWRAVVVDDKGWEVVSDSPVCFRRSSSMRNLPIPTKGGSLSKLWKYLNVKKNDRILIVVFIFECWRNNTNFPILELTGEQGSAKSFTQTIIREFTDPNAVAVRSPPKCKDDLFVSAGANWLTSFDNMSKLSSNLQDAICILSTGGGYSVRKQYTNDEELLIDVARPCVLNGIDSVIMNQDLLDRSIRIELPAIDVNKSALEMMASFEEDKSEIFGSLLTLFSRALKCIPQVKEISDRDRMADFVILGEAVLLALDSKNSFSVIYDRKKSISSARELESSPTIIALLKLVERTGSYKGAYSRLLERLKENYYVPDLPKSARGLSELLKRYAPALRRINVKVTADPQRHNDGYHVLIEKL